MTIADLRQHGWSSLCLGWRRSGAFDVRDRSICFHGRLPEAYLPSGLRGAMRPPPRSMYPNGLAIRPWRSSLYLRCLCPISRSDGRGFPQTHIRRTRPGDRNCPAGLEPGFYFGQIPNHAPRGESEASWKLPALLHFTDCAVGQRHDFAQLLAAYRPLCCTFLGTGHGAIPPSLSRRLKPIAFTDGTSESRQAYAGR